MLNVSACSKYPALKIIGNKDDHRKIKKTVCFNPQQI